MEAFLRSSAFAFPFGRPMVAESSGSAASGSLPAAGAFPAGIDESRGSWGDMPCIIGVHPFSIPRLASLVRSAGDCHFLDYSMGGPVNSTEHFRMETLIRPSYVNIPGRCLRGQYQTLKVTPALLRVRNYCIRLISLFEEFFIF